MKYSISAGALQSLLESWGFEDFKAFALFGRPSKGLVSKLHQASNEQAWRIWEVRANLLRHNLELRRLASFYRRWHLVKLKIIRNQLRKIRNASSCGQWSEVFGPKEIDGYWWRVGSFKTYPGKGIGVRARIATAPMTTPFAGIYLITEPLETDRPVGESVIPVGHLLNQQRFARKQRQTTNFGIPRRYYETFVKNPRILR